MRLCQIYISMKFLSVTFNFSWIKESCDSKFLPLKRMCFINGFFHTIPHWIFQFDGYSDGTLKKRRAWIFAISYFYYSTNKVKVRISKWVFQENKACQMFRKTNISYTLMRTRTCAYLGVKNVCFSENLACFVFLKHLFLDSPFCLITDDLSCAAKPKVAN